MHLLINYANKKVIGLGVLMNQNHFKEGLKDPIKG